jgi:Baseplate J-like protein
MADILDVLDLSTLDPALVAQVQAQISERMAEQYPELETQRGVIHDIVLYLTAILGAEQRTRMELLRESSSLLAISQNPTLSDETIVDNALSNFRITRDAGAPATGTITIVLTTLSPVVVPASNQFSSGSVIFTPGQAYAARINEATVTSVTDRVLRPLGDGTYAFSIPVTATETGSAGMLRRGAGLITLDPIPYFSRAFAESDFTGGFDPETNADMLVKLQGGLAAQAWSNRVTIDAAIRAMPEFARILQTSIIGAGDPEMLRDKHTIMPVANFGRVDLYARTQEMPSSITVTKTATFIQTSAGGGVWQLSIDATDAPGFYVIDRIGPPLGPQDDAGYEVTSDERGFDLEFPGFVPDIVTVLEACYSRYQTATIRFLDTDTPVAGLIANQSSADYSVSLLMMPLIDDMQDTVSGRSFGAPAGDVLVKAPIPCFLTISFNIRKRATVIVDQPTVDAICNSTASLVNSLGFPGQLHASLLADLIQGQLPEGAYLGAIDMFGTIRQPDGALRRIRSTEVLIVPDIPAVMVTSRTVTFLLDPLDVGVSIVDVDMPDI